MELRINDRVRVDGTIMGTCVAFGPTLAVVQIDADQGIEASMEPQLLERSRLTIVRDLHDEMAGAPEQAREAMAAAHEAYAHAVARWAASQPLEAETVADRLATVVGTLPEELRAGFQALIDLLLAAIRRGQA